MPPEQDAISHLLTSMVEPEWYLQRYPDIAALNLDPLAHFKEYGPATRRDPNRFFNCHWYAKRYPQVADSGLDPIIHYLLHGAPALLDPHPRFDAAWYAQQHPDAAPNPVLYHLRTGFARGVPTQKPIGISDFLPAGNSAPSAPAGIFVDVIVPILSSIGQARRCLTPVLAGRTFPLARIIVFDHAGSDAALASWLDLLAAEGQIHLIRDRRRPSFSSCVKRGIEAADPHDIVLLKPDTFVSAESLRRLAGHAWSTQRIATVSTQTDAITAPGYGISTFGRPAAELEQACRTANAGRSVEIPSAIGPCRYFRRDALRAIGGLWEDPKGEADFCRRATAAGWQHRLGCDTYADCRGDSRPTPREPSSFATEAARDAPTGTADPFRFATTAALFRCSGLPVILMVSHNLGGGTRRHVNGLAQRYVGRAHVLLLAGAERGGVLSVPLAPDHPVVTLPPEPLDDLVALLRSAGVSRVHIHHLLDQAMDVRRLIHRLGVPFDVTVHDYYAICPQVNLLPWPEGIYCQEPDRAGCNRCIAESGAYNAKEILSWRREQDWQFIMADRVICPSEDVNARLSRYGFGANALVASHERQSAGDWPVALADDPPFPLRIALLGVLANHKGTRIVASVAETAEPRSLAIHLIGHLEDSFPKPARKFIAATGKYQDHELEGLLRRANPHLLWLPSTAPETYSYTLTAAIETGLPIVATRLGSFPERLAGRPNTWLVDYDASTQQWLAVFDEVRSRLEAGAAPGKSRPTPRAPRPVPAPDFYDEFYLSPKTAGRPAANRAKPRIAVLPERSESGAPTTRAYVRLLQPLDHPAIGGNFEILLVDTETVFDSGADIVVTQRHAIPDVATADRLAAYVRRSDAALIFDLDDDPLNTQAHHPAKAQAVLRMLRLADTVWLSTHDLASRLSAVRPDAIVLEDRLDERIWTAPPPPAPYWDDPIRILCVRTAIPDADFAMIEPALIRLKADYEERITIDVLAMARPRDLPRGINGLGPSTNGGRSYPGFVDWMTRSRPAWHIGLAPLRDTPQNRARSPATVLEYAAMGLAILASDVSAYRGSIADGPAGQLVPNSPLAWHAALDWLIRDQDLRLRYAVQARPAFVARGTLAGAAGDRVAALRSVLPADGRQRLARHPGRVNYAV